MPRSELSADTSVQSFTSADTSATVEVEKRSKKKYKWHKKFAYQKFKGWRPILTPHNAEAFFIACGVLLIALGVPILVASLNVVEYRKSYGFEGPFADKDPQARQEMLWAAFANGGVDGISYNVSITVDKRMEPPIWVAFELGTFFQNFRRYVRSYDPVRMHDGGGSPVSACAPYSYLNGSSDFPINPCGQIAHSFFNDSFSLAIQGVGPLALDDSDIAWPSDRDDLYGPVPAEHYNPGGSFASLRGGNTSKVLLNENQHWMVWMRPHSKVALQKLYGRIDTPIDAGQEVVITVNNRYNTYSFDGTKTIILTTNSWVGGKNIFLGALYLATGGVCLLTALFFFVSYDLGLIWKRRYGDLANVSWLRQHAAELYAQKQFAAAAAASSSSRGANSEGNGVTRAALQDDATTGGAAAMAGAAAAAAAQGGQPPKN